MGSEGARTKTPWAVFAIVLAALALTTDDRFFGGIRDGKEMLSAAFSMARFGEIGISRGFFNAAPAPAGDAFSRYGIGTSIAEVVPMLLSRALRGLAPGAATGPVFVLLPILSLAAAAAFVARSAALLGAKPSLCAATGLALVFASPLWGYGGSDYSEPLQVATLALTVLAVLALGAGAPSPRRWEVVAGVAAAFAVLLKSLNILPVSLLLLPSLLAEAPAAQDRPSRKKRNRPAAKRRPRWVLVTTYGAGLLIWAVFELLRFGKLFGGYPGETFIYPFFTGLLRLTVLPNKGLLVYAPLLVLVPLGFLSVWKNQRALAASFGLAAASYFATAAGWWAWDGQSGWGPRLVVPAIPVLFLLAGLALKEARPTVLAAAAVLAAAGFLVNLPGALFPFGGVYLLAEVAEPQPISEARAEGTPYEILRLPDGTLTATGPHHLSLSPSWWPPRVHARLIAERAKGGDVVGRLRDGALRDLDPPFLLRPPDSPSAAFDLSVAPFRWPFWGRSWISPPPRGIDPYRDAVKDQLARAEAMGNERRAETLRKELEAGGPATSRAAYRNGMPPGFRAGAGPSL